MLHALLSVSYGISRPCKNYRRSGSVHRATPENVEKLRSALRAAYEGDPAINEISSADLLGDYPAVRYVPPTGDLYFDVMTRLDEVASFETIDAEIRRWTTRKSGLRHQR